MSRIRLRWVGLVLVGIMALGTVAVSVGLRKSDAIPGSGSVTGAASTTAPPRPPDVGQTTDPTGSTAAEPPPIGAPDGAIGAETAGDPYYPQSGNGGYDVASYLIAFSFDPAQKKLAANATIVAIATESDKLGRFSFDLQPTMKVSAITVDGKAAGFTQADAKLVITPLTGVASGASMTVVVTYAGTPGEVTGGTSGLADGGWYTTGTGGAAVMGEPYTASAWYPANEHPTDRASFGVIAQVPTGWSVISNGLPVTRDLPAAPDGYTTFGWTEKSEMASYLTVLYIDKFTLTQDTSSAGIPIINAYGPGASRFQQFGDQTSDYLQFLASRFGPYPFDTAGGIFMTDSVGFAMETQTRPIYSGFADESTVVHELAHQWFGDDVVVHRWADICLNECFASYAEWLWNEHNGTNLDDTYRQQINSTKDQPSFWRLPLVDMGAGHEFGDVYSRGPLALHALRAEIGDEKFSELLLSWIEEYSGKTASWSDFEDLVDQISGKDVSGFMDAWFRKTGVPAAEFLYPGTLHP